MEGGIPDYSYSWDNGEISDFLTDLEAVEYSVTVSDINGCDITESFVITELEELNIVPVVLQPDCVDGSLGSIKLEISGGEPSYSVLWNTGETADTLGNLASGNYFATITDSNGCIDSTSVVIESVSSLSLMAEVIEETCLEAGNGSIELNILSSNGSVDYLWSDGTTTNKIENLTSGNYEVTISDESGCIGVYT